jgi:SAM-dependent methyltransferase
MTLARCRVCDGTDLVPAVDLGRQPWCNHFLRKEEVGTEPYYPLRVVFCPRCATAQLDYTVPKEVMFGDHTYLSGVTASLSRHFEAVAREVSDRFLGPAARKSVLDIGSNDGTQLRHYKALGFDVLGVESSRGTAALANEGGIETLQAFFTADLADSLDRRFDVVNASGVFFHLEELHSVTEGIRRALARNGVFVIQFLYMKSIVENGAFDQIYHEHLLYYTLASLSALLGRHGLELFDAYLAPIHGGSVVAFAGHPGERAPSARLAAMRAAEARDGANTLETYRAFAARIETIRDENVAYLRRAKAEGKRVFGLGAPVKGNTLLNYFGAGPDLIQLLVERNALRRGLYSPGQHIPIVIEDELEGHPEIYYVLAWNFRDEIMARMKPVADSGVEFYFPVIPRQA